MLVLLDNLKTLNLSANGIGNYDSETLKLFCDYLPKLKPLEGLVLDQNNLHDLGYDGLRVFSSVLSKHRNANILNISMIGSLFDYIADNIMFSAGFERDVDCRWLWSPISTCC